MIDEEITVYQSCGDPNNTTFEHKIKLEHNKVCDYISLYIDGHGISFDDYYIEELLELVKRFNDMVYPNHEIYKISNNET